MNLFRIVSRQHSINSVTRDSFYARQRCRAIYTRLKFPEPKLSADFDTDV